MRGRSKHSHLSKVNTLGRPGKHATVHYHAQGPIFKSAVFYVLKAYLSSANRTPGEKNATTIASRFAIQCGRAF